MQTSNKMKTVYVTYRMRPPRYKRTKINFNLDYHSIIKTMQQMYNIIRSSSPPKSRHIM